MNIASRAGRWSAAHWKTATFGWLAMVVCAVAVGHLVGTVKLTDSEQSTGQSARAQLWLNQSGFANHAGEAVLIQSGRQKADGPGFRQEIKTVVAGLEALPQIDAHAVTAGRRQPGPDLQGRPFGADRVQHEGRRRHGGRPRAAGSQRGGGATAPRPAVHRRRVRRRQLRARAERNHQQRSLKGRDPVAPDHLSGAAGGLWRLRRRRPAGGAGVLGGPGLGRIGRRGQPPGPRLRRHQLGDAADGDGGRRRLFAVLPQTRARGAASGPR